ncbi:TPA: type II toxin-antitoxin system RelE/ParE family toxin, partial [Escherichia coli]|nr:type II toxin-antitoxin system RelE/ParE family toxin [Escherichia coli]HAU9021929.1 type II toxin-antitoxin system RelE/ParE family toxin [Escherichia coli]HDC0960730.1 type II toxin-antitoxin system RelE/ParE family toxin [Escherichia coli]HDC1877250.1 type II toxin-antitoxin system RelE/ParE family toxin [Escherichia coli]
LENPRVPASRLHGYADRYKIKLRTSGYRLVYQVIDEKVVLLVISVGKREGNEVYQIADMR